MRDTDRPDENLSSPLRAAASLTTDRPPAPGRWTKPPPSPSQQSRTVKLIRGTTILGSVAATLAFREPMLLLAGVSALLSWGTTGRRHGGAERPNGADLRLLEDPADPDVCLVRVEVFYGDRSVGADRGVAWFADGLLLFSGHRTSFALGGQDIRIDRDDALPECDLRLRVRGAAVLRIAPLDVNGGGGPQDMRFLKRRYEFRRRPPFAHGDRQWPPLEPWTESHEEGIVDANR